MREGKRKVVGVCRGGGVPKPRPCGFYTRRSSPPGGSTFCCLFFMLFCYAKFDFNVLANALNNCRWERGKGRREIETVKKKQRGQIV